mmetsp:Transcript_46637/g.96300  ORF Transcript_46637/g.96300 Transcript_46637/m.96300 type:complete len:85 (-) Transcript_46637:51-305(-)
MDCIRTPGRLSSRFASAAFCGSGGRALGREPLLAAQQCASASDHFIETVLLPPWTRPSLNFGNVADSEALLNLTQLFPQRLAAR